MKKVLLMIILGVFMSSLVNAIPTEFTYTNTKYVNCHLNQNFPVQVNKELSSISGKVESEQGTKSSPYNIIKIKDNYIFDASTGKQLINFEELLSERITAKGYYDKGNIMGTSWMEEEKEYTIKTVDSFYITEIEGWQNICCNSISGDTGQVNNESICMWFNIGNFDSQIKESNYSSKPEIKRETPNFMVKILDWLKSLFS